MSSIIKSYKIGDNTYMFICRFRSTRNGFAHDCELIKNTSSHLSKATCHYINRTWERYTYQSVMIHAIKQKLEDYATAAREQFKREHNLSRITAKRKPELEAFIANQFAQIETWHEIRELLEQIV